MEEFTKEQIDSLADKLLIGLTDEENKTVLDEFASIKRSMDLIMEIPNISEVSPQSFPFEMDEVVLRDNTPSEEIDIDVLLSNCDNHTEYEIEVPKVVG